MYVQVTLQKAHRQVSLPLRTKESMTWAADPRRKQFHVLRLLLGTRQVQLACVRHLPALSLLAGKDAPEQVHCNQLQ